MAEPSPEEEAAAASMLAAMNPDIVAQIRKIFDQSETGEEFVNQIMVGDCPQCGSSKTGDCENDPEIDDPCVGRCFECGQLWCLDCGEYFKANQAINHDCPAWEDMDLDLDEDLDFDDGNEE